VFPLSLSCNIEGYMQFRILISAVAILSFSGVSVLSLSGPTWAAEGVLLADKHKGRGTECSGCHKESPPVRDGPMPVCLGCHGDYWKVAAQTNKLDPNPHDSHLGEIDCGKCHHAHKASVNFCNECHQFDMKVP
jgi:fumarate reductase flavoprotein subunit